MPSPVTDPIPARAVAILAAGLGTRMRSTRPKVLHELAGRPLVDHVLDLALQLAPPELVVTVVGHGADQVAAAVGPRGVLTALQEPQLGTGDALRVALARLGEEAPEEVLVLSGDVPLLRLATVTALADRLSGAAAAAILTARLDRPSAYGRVVRGADGSVEAIVEARDADPATLALPEVNAGVYAFRREPLRRALARLGTDNAQGEYYLTDVVGLLRADGLRVAAQVLDDSAEMQGVNSRADLAEVARLLNRRLVAELMASGVTMLDPATTWVEPDCRVAADVVLEAGVHLRGGCRVGTGARVGAHSVVDGVDVPAGAVVPPLTHLRP
jgi:bifunctional UDP-N-acetylglucosamine pyrophosphorylase/glucosamine-1-phosphate N-acetyltransferase